MRKILILGQTPPPMGGQAIMIEQLLSGNYDGIQLFFVRMGFSKEMEEMGKINIGKIIELIDVIRRIIITRVMSKADVLYYPPAGPNKIPLFRDIAILIATRWMFRKTIFHFHASGLTTTYKDLPGFIRHLFRKAYFSPDAVIRISEFTVEDGEFLQTKSEYIIPNGIKDMYEDYRHLKDRVGNDIVRILFVGLISESKGAMVLLEACKVLRERGIGFQTSFMGEFASNEFKSCVEEFLKNSGLDDCIDFLGVLEGENKWRVFARTDILCFPTFFESESFGLVLIEAFSFEIPVVATNWRGIPSIVDDEIDGYLVPTNDPQAVAEKLEVLIKDPELRQTMGVNGRKKYLNHFTIDIFQSRMREVFTAVLEISN